MLFALFASSLSSGEFVLRRVCSAASLFCDEFVLRRVFRGEFVRGEFSASSCPASEFLGNFLSGVAHRRADDLVLLFSSHLIGEKIMHNGCAFTKCGTYLGKEKQKCISSHHAVE